MLHIFSHHCERRTKIRELHTHTHTHTQSDRLLGSSLAVRPLRSRTNRQQSRFRQSLARSLPGVSGLHGVSDLPRVSEPQCTQTSWDEAVIIQSPPPSPPPSPLPSTQSNVTAKNQHASASHPSAIATSPLASSPHSLPSPQGEVGG